MKKIVYEVTTSSLLSAAAFSHRSLITSTFDKTGSDKTKSKNMCYDGTQGTMMYRRRRQFFNSPKIFLHKKIVNNKTPSPHKTLMTRESELSWVEWVNVATLELGGWWGWTWAEVNKKTALLLGSPQNPSWLHAPLYFPREILSMRFSSVALLARRRSSIEAVRVIYY